MQFTHRITRLLGLFAAVFIAGFAAQTQALSEKRQKEYVARCSADWVKMLPTMGEDGAQRMCRCMTQYMQGLDDSLSDDELNRRAMGPVNINAKPDVYLQCIQPAFQKSVAPSVNTQSLPPQTIEPDAGPTHESEY